MKKSLFIIGLALAALTVSCSKDVELQPAVGGKVTLGVAIESETRTALGALNGGKYDVVWSEGDCLAVNGTKSEAVEAAYVGKTTAQFTVSGVEAPYNVLYPASVLGKDGNITVPTVQNYTEGSFAAGSAVAVGYTTGSAVTLKNLYSFVKLTIAKGDDVALKSVALQTVGGEAISGVYSVDYQNAEIRAIAGQSVIRIMDVPYGADNKAVVYIAVPAGKYEGGFTVTVTGADGKCMTKKASKITDVPAGYLVNMPEFTYAGTARSEVVITSAAELVEFATVYNSGFDGVALLGNDIDMTGAEELPYFSLLEGALFDGQGYAIKNWTSNHGLINVNYGTVKNLTIDQSCNLTFDMSNTDASTPHGLVVNSNVGLVSGCINNADVTVTAGDVVKDRSVGAIVGIIGTDSYSASETTEKYINARVENCINNGDISITVDSYASGWFFAGGVAGSYYPNKLMSTNGGVFNCVNNGVVDITISDPQNRVMIGGVVGSAGKASGKSTYCTIKDCINNGDVSYTSESTDANSNAPLWIGGIVGNDHAVLADVTNTGAVTVNMPSAKTWTGIGGIAGYVTGDITNALNKGVVTGNVKSHVAGGNYYLLIAGIAATTKDAASHTLTGCTNEGKIVANYSSNKNSFVAGLVGLADKPITLENCNNNIGGEIDANITATATIHMGGLVGYAYSAGNIITSCNNRGKITAATISNSNIYFGGLFGRLAASTVTTCENSGIIANTNTAKDGTSTQPFVGGIAGWTVADITFTDCVNRGAISAVGDLKKESSVGGLAATNYCTFNNCKSLGNLHIEDTSELAEYVLIAGIGCRQGATTTWNGGEVNCAITYEGTNVVCGILQGKFWGSTTVGETTPLVIKSTTTINGVAVTADDVANHAKLVAFDEGIKKEDENGVATKVPVEQVSDPDLGGANTIGTADRTKSKFIIAEGGVVLE